MVHRYDHHDTHLLATLPLGTAEGLPVEEALSIHPLGAAGEPAGHQHIRCRRNFVPRPNAVSR
ncbi:hypothetical protein AA14337_3259 [Acetobacter malorum DSM 14337]|uniref:Uncharacterized protein n=1 Tax=Acetobacter malorum DSM 14337 TaxID=1307910 RepID=A0ABQ0Q0K9_9PROT|nr:hypothetical protein AA14337_3259 [Acetobacter malorum DSM 14337]